MTKLFKKTNVQMWFAIIVGLYLTGSVLQNILAVKTFGTEQIAIATGGTLISWFVFACMDIITEVYGKNKAIHIFWVSAILNLAFNGICWIAILIPGNNAFVGDAYKTVLGTGWRISIASITAFLLGNYVNTYIMYILRVKSKDAKKTSGFIFRAVLSTLLGQIVDNGIFYLLAFAPFGIPGTIENSWMTILQLVGFTTLIETVVEGCFSPVTSIVVKGLRKKKEEENYLGDVEMNRG